MGLPSEKFSVVELSAALENAPLQDRRDERSERAEGGSYPNGLPSA